MNASNKRRIDKKSAAFIQGRLFNINMEIKTIIVLGQRLYFVYLCMVYFRSTSTITNFMCKTIFTSQPYRNRFARTPHYQIR